MDHKETWPDIPDYKKNLACRVCNNSSIAEYGAYEICPHCGWEDDQSQFDNPDMGGGANNDSFNAAVEKYKRGEKIT